MHSDIINRIVERMMIRIGRGDDYLLTGVDKWQIESIQQSGVLLEDIQKEIAKATKRQQSEIAEAMEEAGVKAIEYDDAIYKQVGLSTKPLTQSPYLMRLMQRNYEATMGEWNNFTRTTAEASQRLFIERSDRAYHLVSSGAMSYTEAVKEVLETIVSDGVYIKYPSGHRDTIETATLRVIRTGISQATGQIQDARMDELDVDLVITSSHLGARPEHQVWQGKIYSRSGKSTEYPDFISSTGYGTGAGLCGWNCRHSFGPYFEGMDNPFRQYDSEENRKQYEKEQHQRALERSIRDTKREVMGIKTAIDNCKDDDLKAKLESLYQQKAALLEKQNDAYHTYCGTNDLKPLEDRLQIAKWNRKQAAAARGAARKRNNDINTNSKKHLPQTNDSQNYRPVIRSEKSSEQMRGARLITIREIEGSTYQGGIFLSDEVKLKPKEMHNIEKAMVDSLEIVGKDDNAPICVVISSYEMQTGAVCSYNAVKNILYVNSIVANTEKLLELQEDMAYPQNPLSTFVHELFHWKMANNFRKHTEIKDQKEYLQYVRKKSKKKLDALRKKGYNIFAISKYATYEYDMGRYDETYTEYLVKEILRKEQ